MKKYILTCFLTFIILAAFGQTIALDTPLIQRLDSLVKEDQRWRNYSRLFNNNQIKKGADTISREQINRNMRMADSLNYFEVQDIFKKYGFPNYDLVGQEGANNFWVLVQHQDDHPDFQARVLEQLKIEVDANKASGSNYAYLVDRVKVNTGNLQVYGTQMELNSDSTSYQPKPVIDPEQLNERRKSIGLGTIESYIELMNNRYSGTLRKK